MKIKLGTFNLFQFVAPPYYAYTRKCKFDQKQWQEKTAWIKNQILKMDCDIIGFQEVFSKDALKSLLTDLGFKYFETVDVAALCTSEKYKYVSTTLAIASKFPIVNIQEIESHIPSLEMHDFDETFKFSRTPIKATIMLPNKTEILVYVCHLKSNRLNEFEDSFNKEHSLEDKKALVAKSLQNNYSSSIKQRLCEASTLFFDIEKSKNIPKVLLGDLNDKEFSITIDALSNSKYHDIQKEEKIVLFDVSYQYKEKVYNPNPESKEVKRKATSYLKSKGDVLDYIFISNEFNKDNENNIAKTTKYTVFDEHLLENTNGSLLTSDHAQVVCELTFTNLPLQSTRTKSLCITLPYKIKDINT